MNAFEFGQAIGAGLEKQANKYKFLMNLAAPAANAAANTAASTARRAAPAATSGPGTLPAQWVRNHQTIARGVNPATGLKPGAVAPAPPAPVPAKITITPEQAAAATPLPTTPGLRTTGAGTTPGLDPATLNWFNRYSGRPGGAPKPIMPGAYAAAHAQDLATRRAQDLATRPKLDLSGMFPSPKPAAPRNYGNVPTGQTPTAELQSFYNNATGGGRQRMIGIDPQGRGVPAAPQSWEQLSPAQQAAVGQFYSGGK